MGKRPIGVIILAGLHLLGGVAITVSLAMSLRESPAKLFEGMAPVFAVFTFALTGAFNMGAGAGLLMGRKWGWVLSFFFLSLMLLRNLTKVFLVPVMAQLKPASEIDAAYSSFAIVILVQGLIMLYYFKSNVAEFFDLERNVRIRLAIWTVVAALVYLALNIVIGVQMSAPSGPA